MISFILAMGKDRSIGFENKLPWRLPADLAYFKKLTMGHRILMGRKTYESIGKPLPGRVNIVATRDSKFQAEGVEVVQSPQQVMTRYPNDEVFVIGGSQIFEQFLPFADRIYLTFIDHTFQADTFFPELNDGEWEITSRVPGITDERNPYRYEFLIYDRNGEG